MPRASKLTHLYHCTCGQKIIFAETQQTRKHKIQPDELTTLTIRIQGELDQILNAETIIKELEQQVAKAESEYRALAEKLTKSRLEKAKRLQSEVTKGLQGLGMDGAKFKVSLGASPN